MPAVIQFPNGMTATVRGKNWQCSNGELWELLTLTTEMLPSGYHPCPEADLAKEVAARLGATLISSDREPSETPPDAQF
jgi:hypothetical protein